MTRPRLSRSSDGGFTLIELLITVVIIGAITLPLGNMVIAYFQNTVQTQARASVSHDEQIAAAYFAEDASSIGLRNADLSVKQSVWYPSTSGAPITCGSGITPFLAVAWDQYAADGSRTTSEAVYGTQTASDNGQTELQLVRMHCSSSSTPDATSVLVHNLSATPTVTCDGSAANCSIATTLPSVIAMTLVLKDGAGSTAGTDSVTLTGQRRQS